MRGKIFAAMAAVMIGLGLAGCKDELGIDVENVENLDGMGFSLNVVEQSDLIMEIGKARKAAGKMPFDSATVAANAFGSHALSGNSEGMSIHRMVIPMVGIHPNTASGSVRTTGSPMTRSGLDEIVNAGSNPLTFHDSLTIWGDAYTSTDYGRNLFKQILVKKIRGWRTSVHWPYDVKGGKMQFFAISPSFEDLDMQVTNPSYNTTSHKMDAPHFKYRIPDDTHIQRDVLYGVSNEVDIDAGPANTSINYPDGSTEKEQHLGLDDKIVELNFKHILTAVRFAQGKIPTDITIKTIQISHIKNEGEYLPENNSGAGEWTNLTGDIAYTIYPNSKTQSYEAGAQNYYIDGDSVLFLMPQTLGSTAELRLSILKEGESTPRILKASLSGDLWTPGYTVTYKVTIGELKGDYYLVIQSSPADYSTSNRSDIPTSDGVVTDKSETYKQGQKSWEFSTSRLSGSFYVHSFRNVVRYDDSVNGASGKNVHVAEKWKLVGFSSTEDGTYTTTSTTENPTVARWVYAFPGWIKSSGNVDAAGNDGTTGSASAFSYTLEGQEAVYTINHASILGSNRPVSGLNLSTHLPDGSNASGTLMAGASNSMSIYNSANSYIVNAPGTYVFPLVYGNSYQQGLDRSYSMNTASGDIFLDHKGQPIKNGNILEQVNSYTNSTMPNEGTEVANTDWTTDETAEGVSKVTVQTWETYGGVSYSGDVSAELLWQDYYDDTNKGLIYDPSSNSVGVGITTQPTTSTIGFIGFTVNQNAIRPGNALIALKCYKRTHTIRRAYKKVYQDDGNGNTIEVENELTSVNSQTYPLESHTQSASPEILWTWHIWITDEIYPNGEVDSKSNKVDIYYPSYNTSTNSKIVTLYDKDYVSTGNSILPVNLGWVPDEMTWEKYEPREIWVKIKQVNSDEEAYFKIRHEAKNPPVTGTSTVYQWGRPTALPMVNKIDATIRTIYNANGTDITDNFQITKESTNYIPVAFANYDKLMTKGDGYSWWDSSHNYLFWNTTKTLYDPCPPGFQMPPKSIFDVMVIGNSVAYNTNYKGSDDLNMWNNAVSGNGGYFYAIKHLSAVAEPDRYKQVFYVPATGYYSANTDDGTRMSAQQKDRSVGYFWLSDHESSREGSSVYFQPNSNISNATLKFVTEQNHDARPVRPYSPGN